MRTTPCPEAVPPALTTAKVGRPCALTRTGPKRARLSRQQWKEAKTAATREKEALERVRKALTVPERVEAAIALVRGLMPESAES